MRPTDGLAKILMRSAAQILDPQRGKGSIATASEKVTIFMKGNKLVEDNRERSADHEAVAGRFPRINLKLFDHMRCTDAALMHALGWSSAIREESVAILGS